MMVIAWIVAIAAWVVILLSPVALVALLAVPRCRRWWLRPLQRRVAERWWDRTLDELARRERQRVMEQARRDARTAVLEAELAALDDGIPTQKAPPAQATQPPRRRLDPLN